jgi:hypothetical protein
MSIKTMSGGSQCRDSHSVAKVTLVRSCQLVLPQGETKQLRNYARAGSVVMH